MVSFTASALALTMSPRIASEILEVTKVAMEAGMMTAESRTAHPGRCASWGESQNDKP